VGHLGLKSKAFEVIVEHSRREASLWRQLKHNGDESCRQMLFDQYRDFALMLSNREFRRRPSYGFEKVDFDQLAYCGLLQAIDRFDALSDYSFKTFARYRIVGSIADGIASSSERASAYKASRRLERDRLYSLMKDSDDEPLSTNLDSLRELAANLAIGVLIESVTQERLETIEDSSIPNGYESLRFNQVRTHLFDEIRKLPEIQQDVVNRHYLEDMTFTLIAQLLSLTKGRISQLHSAAIKHLRGKLTRR